MPIYRSSSNSKNITLKNLITNNSFEDGSTSYFTYIRSSQSSEKAKYGSYSIKSTNGGEAQEAAVYATGQYMPKIIKDHKYYCRSYHYTTAIGTSYGLGNRGFHITSYPDGKNPIFQINAFVSNFNLNSWEMVSSIASATNSGTITDCRFGHCYASAFNGTCYTDGAMMIDLTEAFGIGSEPSKEWLDANIPWFDNTLNISYAGGLNRKVKHQYRSFAGANKSIILKNLVVNSDFSNGSNGWTLGTCTIVAGRLENNSNVIYGHAFSTPFPESEHGPGDKLYCRGVFKCRTNTDNSAHYSPLYDKASTVHVSFMSGNSITQQEIHESLQIVDVTQSIVHTLPQTYNKSELCVAVGGWGSAGTGTRSVSYDNILVINLTRTFGPGNEPSKEWLDGNIPWFANTLSIGYGAGGLNRKIIRQYASSTNSKPITLKNLFTPGGDYESGDFSPLIVSTEKALYGTHSVKNNQLTNWNCYGGFSIDATKLIDHKFYRRDYTFVQSFKENDIIYDPLVFYDISNNNIGETSAGGPGSAYPLQKWHMTSFIIQAPKNSVTLKMYVGDSYNTGYPSGVQPGSVFYTDGTLVIDLTKHFGPGSEPTREWCDANIPWFANTLDITYGGGLNRLVFKEDDGTINYGIYDYGDGNNMVKSKYLKNLHVNGEYAAEDNPSSYWEQYYEGNTICFSRLNEDTPDEEWNSFNPSNAKHSMRYLLRQSNLFMRAYGKRLNSVEETINYKQCIHSGTRVYNFTEKVTGEKTVIIELSFGNLTGHTIVSNLYFNTPSGKFTLEQMVKNQMIKPLVLMNSAAQSTTYIAKVLDLYNNSSSVEGSYAAYIYAFMTNPDTIITAVEFNCSKDSSNGDGLACVMYDTKELRFTLNPY